MNKMIAETLEVSGATVRAQCLSQGLEVGIGSLVLIEQGQRCFVAIVGSVSTQSRFPGGIQAFGLQGDALAREFPELSFVEVKILELVILLHANWESGLLEPAFIMPNPHACVLWPEPQLWAKILSSKAFLNAYCSMLSTSALPERLLVGFGCQIQHLELSQREAFYQAVFVKLCQGAPTGLDLVRVLCQSLELIEPELQF